jgi:hypothetical protein
MAALRVTAVERVEAQAVVRLRQAELLLMCQQSRRHNHSKQGKQPKSAIVS